jgi:uncharacterized damage-inducible protein DinB
MSNINLISLPISITTRLERQHESLFDLIDGLTDEQLRRQIIPGKWSVFENVVHLATYQHEFMQRVHKIMAEENPKFSRYVAESDPSFYDNCTKTTEEILHDLVITRKELVTEIVALNSVDLGRTGEHPVFGRMNMVRWLHFFLLHEAHHLFTVFKLAPGTRQVPTDN